jgi:hypothetical protein
MQKAIPVKEWLFYIIGPGQVGSVPFKLGVNAVRLRPACRLCLFALMHVVELRKVHVWHQLCLHMIHRIVQRVYEFVEVFFVEENLVLFVRKSIILEPLFTFGDRQIIIIRTGCFDVKKVSSLACLYLRGVDFVPAVILVFFHNPSI